MTDQSQHLDGGQLRQMLEQTIEQNKTLTAQLASERAVNVITAQGFDLVKPEDLAGIAVGEIPAKAAELQQQRRDSQLTLLKDVLRRNGTPDDQLDQQAQAMMAGQAGTQQNTQQDAAWLRAMNMPAGAPSPLVDTTQLHGDDAIRYALEQQELQRSKT